jgi:Tol biopolymer transport system component
MGDTINSSASENRPYVTVDNEYLFFTSNKTGNRQIYWVDAKILKNYK